MSHKILCIDDEPHNLEALQRLLRKSGEVFTAESGPEALKLLEQNDFSLIISDQKMPEMTGVQFFEKAQVSQPDAIRILLTGYTDLESVINAINKGRIYRYVTKPWDPEEFKGVVAQALEVFSMKKTISAQNQELKVANEELKSLDRLKTDFMLLVNHELKTPLTGIFSFVQLLSEESLNAEQKLYVEKISKNTKRLENLINDTLLITRLKNSPEEMATEEINLAPMVEEQWQKQAGEYPKKELTLELKTQRPFVQSANKKYLEIVMRKLLSNCFVHAPTSSQVTIELAGGQNQWQIHCENPMSGELSKDVKNLVTAFSTDGDILNHAGGTGLGLAVIHSILNLFQGQLSISAESHKFRVSLSFPR